MPNLLDTIADLEFDGVDLQRADLTVHLVLIVGLYETVNVRGSDVVVPHKAGRTARSRVSDVRQLILEGYVMGQGATDDDVLESYQASMLLMGTTFDPTAAPAALTGTLPDGSTASILARAVPPLLIEELARSRAARVNIQLESVVPNWTITPGGS